MNLIDLVKDFRYFLIGRKVIQASRKTKRELPRKKIQAASEGAIGDILSTNITGTLAADNNQKINAYKTYSTAVQAMYNMYNGYSNYGGEFLKSIVRTRVAFIAGGGVTVVAEKEKTNKWIEDFLKYNKLLEGSKLFDNVLISELEGKDLLVLKANRKKEKIEVRNFYWAVNPYKVEMEPKDNQVIKQVVYKSEKDITDNKGKIIAPIERLVFVKTGGSPDKINDTMPIVGNCLSDVENASRIKYDLRYNNHLYGRLTPIFKTVTAGEAKSLANLLMATNWTIGKAYCGTADFSLIGPPDGATEALEKELQISNRIISINAGIPIHWLSWPELMSNRATAENLLEVINAATIMEREIWEEGLTELVQKAMEMATILGLKGAVNDPDGFEIKLPLISEAKMKEIQEVWIPLADAGYISKDSVRNKIPGINPNWEKKMIEKEKKEITDKVKNKFGNEFDIHEEEEEGTEEESNDKEDK